MPAKYRFLLDTNVVSELMKPNVSEVVLRWIDGQSERHLYTSSVVWLELLYGLECMPDGRRKEGLRVVLAVIKARLFPEQILAFDEVAAGLLSTRLAEARRTGLQVETADAQIAATALQHGLVVVTRDVSPYEALGVEVFNPWVD